mgnify:CR=1 FL=1
MDGEYLFTFSFPQRYRNYCQVSFANIKSKWMRTRRLLSFSFIAACHTKRKIQFILTLSDFIFTFFILQERRRGENNGKGCLFTLDKKKLTNETFMKSIINCFSLKSPFLLARFKASISFTVLIKYLLGIT